MKSSEDAISPALKWRAASHCSGGQCVQVAYIDGMIAVRDSKSPEKGYRLYAVDAWARFVEEVKAGKHDLF
ncbi:DUF397 domain-containing protein [Nonomuraea sp. MTCD27]|uniref:DUF397 domain-containing protein n=1 Tax=Nonomuraea sp. MTCD27 TaxID=1676747 RepID=UPI0035C010A1